MVSFNDMVKYAVAFAIIWAGAWVWVEIEARPYLFAEIWASMKLITHSTIAAFIAWKLYPRARPQTRSVALKAGLSLGGLMGIAALGVEGHFPLREFIIVAGCFILFFSVGVVIVCAFEEARERITQWQGTFNQADTVSAYAGAQASAPSGGATSHGFDPSRFKTGGANTRHPDDAHLWKIVDDPKATDQEKHIARLRIREAEALRRVKEAEARMA